ncbi:MAG: NUDIX domain-containing protein [Rhodospirillales bacterium]|nr:NUDIX domain-containing protein [Rhodospirillales bacterium]
MFEESFELRSVAALLITNEGRYLMQHRDPHMHVSMRDMWSAFGGWIEAGETAKEAIIRELQEEIGLITSQVEWFFETAYSIPGGKCKPIHKTFFQVPILLEQIDDFVQKEGQGMCLFTPQELCATDNYVPWDMFGVLNHALRQKTIERHKNPLNRQLGCTGLLLPKS